MFEVQIGDTKVGVRFRYGVYDYGRSYVGCFVENHSNWALPHYLGVSLCSHDDNFNKNTGRKIALTRAIQKAPRSVRKIIWNKYFETRGKVD